MPTTTKALKLSRLTLRKDQLIELHIAPLPEPPENFLKLPGAAQLWSSLKLSRERDQQAFHRMVQQMGTAVAAAMTTETVTTPAAGTALTVQQILAQILPTLLGLFIKKAESDSISGPLYSFTPGGANMRWKNGTVQIKSDNANSSGQIFWHTLRVVYVDDVATPFVDQIGES